MNNYIKIFSFIALAMVFNSCSWLMIGSHPKSTSYKYYSKDFKLQVNSPLKIDGFYYSKLISKSNGELYYSYLKFYENGMVNSKFTKGTPEIIKESYWPFNDVYGYYHLDGNHITYELKSNYGTYRHGEGDVINDTLSLKVFEKRSNEDTTYYCKYIFHSGFAR
jgi:hypothetical protein